MIITFHYYDRIPAGNNLKGRRDYLGSWFQKLETHDVLDPGVRQNIIVAEAFGRKSCWPLANQEASRGGGRILEEGERG